MQNADPIRLSYSKLIHPFSKPNTFKSVLSKIKNRKPSGNSNIQKLELGFQVFLNFFHVYISCLTKIGDGRLPKCSKIIIKAHQVSKTNQVSMAKKYHNHILQITHGIVRKRYRTLTVTRHQKEDN